nr:alpha/beta hydrolase [Frigoribacterium endophyticum]
MNHDTDPAAVAAWWASLGDGTGAADPAAPDSLSDSQRTLLRWVPEALGDREGLPYTVRDTANRAVLASTIDDLESTIEAIESGSYVLPEGSSSAASDYATATAALAPLLVLRDKVGRGTPEGTRPTPFQRQLVNLDTSVVPPLAAVALGDVDRASHVSVMVSGMFSSVEESTGGALADGRAVQQSTQSRLRGDDTAATIVWLDYDSPNAATVNLPFHAQVGGERLADATRGVDAVGDARGSETYVSVLAHSYGSTTLVEALKEPDTGVDVAATYGSPGVYADSLDDFEAPRDGVYATLSPTDVLARTGWALSGVRVFPTDIDGVTSFSSGDETAPGGQSLDASSGHSDYLRPGTTSVYNLGYIAAGHGDEVIR